MKRAWVGPSVGLTAKSAETAKKQLAVGSGQCRGEDAPNLSRGLWTMDYQGERVALGRGLIPVGSKPVGASKRVE